MSDNYLYQSPLDDPRRRRGLRLDRRSVRGQGLPLGRRTSERGISLVGMEALELALGLTRHTTQRRLGRFGGS